MEIGELQLNQVPAEVRRLCRTLQRAGCSAYLVGGSVRDLLLRRPMHDWDLATSAPPEQVTSLFPRTIPTGVKHGTVTVLAGELQVEVTTYRGEARYSDGRHPDSVTFVSSIEEDLSRRDFTINAIALDPLTGALVDPFGGADDLRRQVIRAVGDAAERFREDGLRPLRAVRFSAVLELEVEESTLQAIPLALDRFERVSAERVREELMKLLVAPRPSRGIELMRRTGLLQRVLPELTAAEGLTQNRHHSADVYTHSLHACDAVRADPILRLTALLHDIGKVETAQPHPTALGANTFHGHEARGAELAQAIGRRLKLSNEERERVAHLIAHHFFELEGANAPALRRFIRRVGPEHLDDILVLRAADLADRPEADRRLAELGELRARLTEVRREGAPLSTNALAVDGRAIMEHLQIPPGPEVGKILRELLERVTDDPSLNSREALLRLAEELRGKAG